MESLTVIKKVNYPHSNWIRGDELTLGVTDDCTKDTKCGLRPESRVLSEERTMAERTKRSKEQTYLFSRPILERECKRN